MPNQKSSKAKSDWDYQKSFHNSQSQEIDKLMDMVGLESVKAKFLAIKATLDLSVRQNRDLSRERFGSVLLGNPGTGKTTVARLYAKFLAVVGIIPGHKFVETTGSRLANGGVSECQKTIETLLKDGGGAIFIDEAYQLVQGSSLGGGQVLDFLLAEVENLTGKIVFILAGYQRPMEKFFAHNPGLPSRFPHELKFDDFDDTELMRILESWIEKTYNKQMKVDDGLGGLYCRISARRIGRGRGREGFANARAVENAMAKVSERQSERLTQQRRQGATRVDDFFLDGQDMIGPDPGHALKASGAWQRLQGMIGLGAVKKTVEALVDTIRYNYRRELDEQPLVEYSLNQVFLGNPGTGKTSIAKIYGQILVDIGFLSNGEVVVKNPSDFVGSVMGESEKNTKGILAATLGKVLVIDEAYGFSAGGTADGTGATSDPYRSAVVDAIVAEVQSTPGDDRCVLLLGYKDQMQQMFQNVNPGLSRRFPMDQAFVFEDFTKEELDLILDLKLKEQGYGITDRGRRVVSEMLERARNRAHFGNAGEIDILLNTAKMRHQKRLSSSKSTGRTADAVLDAADFDENFDRADQNKASVSKMFEGVVGCESIVSKLEGYQQMVKTLRQLNLDPREQLPFNFVFRGPPGTGKTSTARKMGQVYYDMGLLASNEVIETSATDLVGQYVGQTGPKTQQVLERSLGKVLFIDEAYRLAEGHFAKEAMDELVDCITKPKFAQRLIIILAGYDADINRLMSINPGLTSRFPESLQFDSLSPRECIQLLDELLSKEKRDLRAKSQVEFDITCLQSLDPDFTKEMLQRFGILSQTASWANARDVGTLAKSIFGKTLRSLKVSSGKKLHLGKETVIEELDSLINERSNRANYLKQCLSTASNRREQMDLPQRTQPGTQLKNQNSTKADVASSTKPDTAIEPDTPQQATTSERDPGVTDEVWAQLEKDKAAAEAKEKEYLRMMKEEEDQKKKILRLKEEEDKAAREAEEARQNADEDLRRRHEQARLQHEMQRRKEEAIARELEKQREALAEARRQEQAHQQKLRAMGVCVAGFRWIKQSGGYRCAGGSHWVSDAQLQCSNVPV
ncbi:P-loop containing nucleoside triphosphate hydrolase protein [Aspergillus californicus]